MGLEWLILIRSGLGTTILVNHGLFEVGGPFHLEIVRWKMRMLAFFMGPNIVKVVIFAELV